MKYNEYNPRYQVVNMYNKMKPSSANHKGNFILYGKRLENLMGLFEC